MQTWSVSYAAPKIKSLGLPRVFSKRYLTGAAAGTLVATSKGWRAIDTLAAGDQIWTFDSGLQTLLGIKRSVVKPGADSGRPEAPLVRIPAFALGNEHDILCTSTSGILLECEQASDPMGEPFAVLPVSALVGLCDVSEIELTTPVPFYALQLSNEEAVYFDSGLPFYFNGLRHVNTPRYDLKTHDEAKELLTDNDVDELALREPYEDFFTEFVADRA